MIQLYEGTSIEVLSEGDEAFFRAKDVFKALDLTWRGVYTSLNRRGVDNDEIRKGAELAYLNPDEKILGNVPVYISEMAVYQLAFRSNKHEAKVFTKWCASVITIIRKTGKFQLSTGEGVDLKEHCYIENQKENSKKANSKAFDQGGVQNTIAYNRRNMKLHTGMTPSQVKEVGRQKGLKSKDRSSGKEVLRNLKPELAASMSLTDSLVTENGIDHHKAAKISTELATPLFKKLMELGIDKDKLIK